MSVTVEGMPVRLAAAAFDLFSQRGIARVRMDEIAAVAGVTKGSLYWHYQSKREVKTFYLNLLVDATAGGELAPGDPEKAVDLMLSAMEGYKLRALFEPELCARSAERRIAAELLGLVGFGR